MSFDFICQTCCLHTDESERRFPLREAVMSAEEVEERRASSIHLLCRRDNKCYVINQTEGTFGARLTTWWNVSLNSSSAEWLYLKVQPTPRTSATEKHVEKTSFQLLWQRWKDVQRRAERKFLWVVFSFQRSPLMSNWRQKFLNCNFRLLFSSTCLKLKFLWWQNSMQWKLQGRIWNMSLNLSSLYLKYLSALFWTSSPEHEPAGGLDGWMTGAGWNAWGLNPYCRFHCM